MQIDALRWARQAFRSLTLKLQVLGVIFFALPIVLYGRFESADRRTRDLVVHNMKDRSRLIAQALTPALNRPDTMPGKELNADLAKFADRGTVLRLLLQPSSDNPGQRFFYIATSASAAETHDLGAELESLAAHGVLQRLAQSCVWDSPIDIRYTQPDGNVEVLTSVVPVKSR